ncbi:MAG TPA: aspartate ammonia-lyase [Xanthomonadales bacterium]|nr:aspartate ammonia-lyase [Xanthomonadales bacterium]
MNNNQNFRVEHDLLGDEKVPATAYYGIQTQRALRNFNITGVPIGHFPELIRALAIVKRASASANNQLGLLTNDKADAIEKACAEIERGRLHEEFVVDLIQGGAGTSTNMNANEVIANRALEILGFERGDYRHLHPNNDVNMSQSTNDVYPTAVRLAMILAQKPLVEAMNELVKALQDKAAEFSGVLKMGRTQLQDAVPMTLGQEFEAWAITVGEDIKRIDELAVFLTEINLGGTAIGTGINTHPDYAQLATDALSDISGIKFKLAQSLIEATSDMGAFVMFSGILKRVAIKQSKICNDLRLLSSGPRAGLGEINLPPMQPGSSIMPGKVNPVIPEAVNQTAFQVIGNDLVVTMASEAGQLQLNAFEPVVVYNLMSSVRMLTKALGMLTERCIRGITANHEYCRKLVDESIGVITAFSPHIGYEHATRVAERALKEDRGVVEIIREEGLLDDDRIEAIMDPTNLTGPSLLLGVAFDEETDRSHTHGIRDPD